jgi:hypothetical protein
MKKFAYILFAAAALVLSGSVSSAQGKYGADSAECIKYLSYYQEYYKQHNYDAALPNWRKAYKLCPPTASQNMFVHGTTLMTRLYSATKDAAARAAIADTVIALQDQRLATYPKNKISILNNKGNYIIKYKENDTKFVYDNLNDIIEKIGAEARPSLLVYDLQSSIKLYKEGALTADNVIADYNKVIDCINNAVAKNDEEAAQNASVKRDLESIFADSKVASCDNIIAIFGPRFEENPNDQALVTTIVKLMNSAEDCFSNDLYLKAVTSMHKNEPSAQSAYFLYKLNSSRDNVDEAISYLEEAVAGADAENKAEYCYELANYALKNKMKGKAYDAARRAADLGNGFEGKAYYLIGTIWLSTSCSGNEIQRRAPYWVATDYFQKAKNADPSLTDDCNRMIGQASSYYPQVADAFMYDLSAGQAYTVSCGGMTATTTVRVAK